MGRERVLSHFYLAITLIAAVLVITLAFAVLGNPALSAGNSSSQDSFTGQNALVPGVPTYTYIGNIYGPPYNESKTDDAYPLTFNQTPPGGLKFSEYVIAYFREMPRSMDEFASDYNITPVFVKPEIRMAAFEVVNHLVMGISDGKTSEAIEKLSNDSRVEMAKRDTYMFVDKSRAITTVPEVRYPEYYERQGIGYAPNEVIVGFWRLPPSIDEFGARYGGKPANVTESDLSILSVMYETDDVKSFIDQASQDPYVRYIVLNGIFRIDDPVLVYDPELPREFPQGNLSSEPKVSQDAAIETARKEFPGTDTASYHPRLYLNWIGGEQRLVWVVDVPSAANSSIGNIMIVNQTTDIQTVSGIAWGGIATIDATTGSVIHVNRIV